MVRHEKHLASFMETVDNRFNNIVREIKSNHDALQYITMELQEAVVENTYINVMALLTSQINQSSILNQSLEEIKLGVHDLVQGSISPFVIPHYMLQRAIIDIEHILSSKFGNVKLLSATPASIYKHSSFLYARDGTSLYVTIKFPVGTYTGNLVLYKVMVFPVPV